MNEIYKVVIDKNLLLPIVKVIAAEMTSASNKR